MTNYLLDIAAREQLIKEFDIDLNNATISANRKSFQVTTAKMSVLFEDGLTNAQMLELVLYRQVRHIIQNSYQSARDKLTFLKRISDAPELYYNLDFNLLNGIPSTKVFEFSHLTPRDEIIGQVCLFSNMNPNSARCSKQLQVLEELLMNAQVNATSLVPKESGLKSQIKVELNETLIAFSAFDPYGALDSKKFLKKIESSQALGIDQSMNFGRGGAGVGSSLIFQNCDSLFLGARPWKKTRVSVIMPYNVTERKHEGLQKSIHLF